MQLQRKMQLRRQRKWKMQWKMQMQTPHPTTAVPVRKIPHLGHLPLIRERPRPGIRRIRCHRVGVGTKKRRNKTPNNPREKTTRNNMRRRSNSNSNNNPNNNPNNKQKRSPNRNNRTGSWTTPPFPNGSRTMSSGTRKSAQNTPATQSFTPPAPRLPAFWSGPASVSAGDSTIAWDNSPGICTSRCASSGSSSCPGSGPASSKTFWCPPLTLMSERTARVGVTIRGLRWTGGFPTAIGKRAAAKNSALTT
mmetsp:Transcript_8012/g.23681  ORF Transcript_8012/g.23681 Transcript_8012/m.23681 type:complete len:250 (+) Transcript_8012:337-1086(+)